jgi:hypothetical protein
MEYDVLFPRVAVQPFISQKSVNKLGQTLKSKAQNLKAELEFNEMKVNKSDQRH